MTTSPRRRRLAVPALALVLALGAGLAAEAGPRPGGKPAAAVEQAAGEAEVTRLAATLLTGRKVR